MTKPHKNTDAYEDITAHVQIASYGRDVHVITPLDAKRKSLKLFRQINILNI